MAFAPQKWYAATFAGLLASTDGGANWSPVHIGALSKLPVESVCVFRDGKELWVASLISLAHSADGGASWKWIDLPPSLGVIQRVEVSSVNDAADQSGSAVTILVRTYKGLFISRDAGATWGAPGHGLPETPVQDMATAGPIFVAAMRVGGLYLSRDSGLTWQRLEGTVPDGLFSSVFAGPPIPGESPISGADEVLYAASATEGLYAIEIGRSPDLAPLGDTGH
jgi:photosystem II stability/assembly factor-like uncharacterized protein